MGSKYSNNLQHHSTAKVRFTGSGTLAMGIQCDARTAILSVKLTQACFQ